ncbi:MAG TPA: hypothetical protein VHP36_10140 [Chitinispirillaceae bacterium]|nr:hypothetical protein [Chitinispirillaceae bacterium]
MKQNLKSLTICLFFTFSAFCSQDFSEEDTAGIFYSELEKSILKEYQLCIGDSLPTRKALIMWKSDINYLTESPDYPALLKKFAEETGIHPSDALPCEIINWSNQQRRDKNETASLLEQSKKSILSRRADSIYLKNELTKNPAKPYDFQTIPFGITKKGFLLLARQLKMNLSDKDNYIIVDSTMIGSVIMKGAFYFNKNGLFTQYELESDAASLDSLDSWIRAQADSVGLFMQQKIGKDPNHAYRVGRFEITQGRLAILKFWNLPDAKIFTGLATNNYRYYAKLIVSSKRKSDEVPEDTIH